MSFAAGTSLTPWLSGTLDFNVVPPLASGETLSCRIDASTAASCAAISGGNGRLTYGTLAQGSHSLNVTITGAAGARSYTLAWEIATPDVLVMGGTPAGITAALAASRQGQKVVLIESSPWLGGVMSGGLTKSDIGRYGSSYLGGISMEVFDRIRRRGQELGTCVTSADCPQYFDFEPRAAKDAFEAMLAEAKNVSVQRNLAITSVIKSGTRITAVETPRGRVEAKMFIDASYEADLTSMAGGSTTMAREGRRTDLGEEFHEDEAGTRSFNTPYGLVIDPYRIPGDPSSGLIPFVQPKLKSTPAVGSADRLVMAYNYRVCVTDDPDNRVPFAKPAGYDPLMYEGAGRVAVAMQASGRTTLDNLYFNPAPTVRSKNSQYFKHDLNGGSVFSTDMTAPTLNQIYPEADAATRAKIALQYRNYIQGLLYYWQTEPRFGALNAKVGRFGLCKDEFVDNGNFPYRLYVRESRRMVGEYVLNANDILRNGRRPQVTDSIGMGAYNMDSHVRQIVVVNRAVGSAPARDMVGHEGGVGIRQPDDLPYPVSYRTLTPRRSEITNLLNPVTLSSTSLAYSSLRMEPTFMALGQAAGAAAALAIESNVAVQAIDVRTLQSRLVAAGQVIYK